MIILLIIQKDWADYESEVSDSDLEEARPARVLKHIRLATAQQRDGAGPSNSSGSGLHVQRHTTMRVNAQERDVAGPSNSSGLYVQQRGGAGPSNRNSHGTQQRNVDVERATFEVPLDVIEAAQSNDGDSNAVSIVSYNNLQLIKYTHVHISNSTDKKFYIRVHMHCEFYS